MCVDRFGRRHIFRYYNLVCSLILEEEDKDHKDIRQCSLLGYQVDKDILWCSLQDNHRTYCNKHQKHIDIQDHILNRKLVMDSLLYNSLGNLSYNSLEHQEYMDNPLYNLQDSLSYNYILQLV